MRSGKVYRPDTLLKLLARAREPVAKLHPSIADMSRFSLRLAASAGLLVSLGVPSALESLAVSAPNFAMVIHGGAGTTLRQT